MKQIASIRVRNVVPARLLVDWKINSTMGIPVVVATMLGRSVRQKSITRTKIVPVVPPTPTAYTIANGASREGVGISSVIWRTASYPIRDKADWSRPRIHAMPSFQPVSFWKVAKTNSGEVLSDVERRTTLATNTLRMDQ
jgi:hypothetical protein